MKTPAQIVRQILIEEGVLLAHNAEAQKWNSFHSFMPDEQAGVVPADAACVYDSPGAVDGRIHRTGEVIEHPGVQLRVRAVDAGEGYAKAAAAGRALAEKVRRRTVTFDGFTCSVAAITRTSTVMSLGVTAGTRRLHQYSVNFRVTIAPPVT